MAIQNPPPVRPSFGKRLWLAFKKLVRFIFRLMIILLILGAIGAALYFGAPVLVDEYLLKDVDANRSRIQEVYTQLEQNNELFSQRLGDFQTRLDALELQNDTDKQTIADLQSQLETAEDALRNQATALETLNNFQAMLAEYEETLTALESQLAGYAGEIESVQSDISLLTESFETSQTELQVLQADLETRDTLVTLRHELELLKAMELITRARVSIGDHNIGLAQDDLGLAYELLTGLSTVVPAHQAVFLADVILRLELATKNLVDLPELANEDLEVAWQLLIPGLPDEPAREEAEVTPAPTAAEGTEAAPTLTSTPLPTPTPTP